MLLLTCDTECDGLESIQDKHRPVPVVSATNCILRRTLGSPWTFVRELMHREPPPHSQPSLPGGPECTGGNREGRAQRARESARTGGMHQRRNFSARTRAARFFAFQPIPFVFPGRQSLPPFFHRDAEGRAKIANRNCTRWCNARISDARTETQNTLKLGRSVSAR